MKFVKLIALLSLTCLLFVGCAGEEKKEEEKPSIKIEKKEEKKESFEGANLVITGDDAMRFNKTELRAKAGEKVRLTLRHIGKLEIELMGHNVVILKQGVNLDNFAARAAVARDNDYIPPGTDEIIAHTKMIGGGETTVIEFTAPEAGEYDFICSFPAHYAMMRGKFIVE